MVASNTEETENRDININASSSCMKENEDKDEHIITSISDDELNDYYDMATDDNTISDEQRKRMFVSDDNVILVRFSVTAKMLPYL